MEPQNPYLTLSKLELLQLILPHPAVQSCKVFPGIYPRKAKQNWARRTYQVWSVIHYHRIAVKQDFPPTLAGPLIYLCPDMM